MMNRQSHLEPKYRTKFKRTITSLRSQTCQTQPCQNLNMTLSEASFKAKQKQQNKKIHTLSKETFITHKKQFLLSRKLFFSKNLSTPKNQHDNGFKKQYTTPSYDQLVSSKLTTQQQVFNVEQAVMKNAFSFHRNMINKIKDDQGTKNILKRWYNNNVSGNIEKLRKIQNYEKEKLQYTRKSASYIEFQQKLKKENKGKGKFFKSASCPKVNEDVMKKFTSASTTPSKISQGSDQLTKLIVRIQPFWYKVRIKI